MKALWPLLFGTTDESDFLFSETDIKRKQKQDERVAPQSQKEHFYSSFLRNSCL